MGVIVIHGAPGSGKTTVAADLHKRLQCPWFEFGWIPEFQQLNPHAKLTYEQEERLSFENLTLVSLNYLKHGFAHVIWSDLRDHIVQEIPAALGQTPFKIFTLYANNETLKQRILTRNNGNDYRDWESALKINKDMRERALLPNEVCLCSEQKSPEELAGEIENSL